MTTEELHRHLLTLTAERAAAALEGLDHDGHEAQLRAEIEAARQAYVGAAVTEIARFRALLGGAQVG